MNNLASINKQNRYGLSGIVNSGAITSSWNTNHHLMHHQLSSTFNVPRLPPNYLCTICRKPGHAKSFCPEAGTITHTHSNFIRTPKGIPRSFQLKADPGHKFAMRGLDGGFVVSEIEYKAAQVIKKDKQLFLDDDENELVSSKKEDLQSESDNLHMSSKIPPELKCPYGNHIIRDAVLVPCCGHFVCCDECIREKISNDGIEEIECPYEGCNIGSLGSITPFHEIRKKVSEYLNCMKLTNKRLNSNTIQDQVDPFLDLILNDVKSEKSVITAAAAVIEKSNSTTKSPLQDSKISSSEALLSLAAANNSSVNQLKKTESFNVKNNIDSSDILGKYA